MNSDRLLREVRVDRNWPALESFLISQLASGTILDYRLHGDRLEVVLEGTTKPFEFTLPKKMFQEQEPVASVEAPKEEKPEPAKPFISFKTKEDYEAHIRNAVERAFDKSRVGFKSFLTEETVRIAASQPEG